MKKFAAIAAPLFLAGLLSASTLDFHAPSFDEPYYLVRLPFEVKEGKVLIREILINGEKVGECLIFKQAKNVPLTAPLEKGTYDVILDYAWAGGKDYRVEVVSQREASGTSDRLEVEGTSPRGGGIPGAREGFYRIFTVEEEIGLERRDEVCTLTLTAPKSAIEAGDFIIYDGLRRVPFQVLEKRESAPQEKVSASHPVTLTYKLALALDAGPNEKKILLVLKGEREAAAETGFVVSGEGWGKKVRNSRLGLEFHPRSGQVNTIESFDLGVRLYNKAGVIHWNPDVFVPPVWDQSFDWNPPPFFEDKAGPLLYLNVRRGPLPRIDGVNLEVKYTFPAQAPYFVSETFLNFEKDLGVIAVRNDEMVFFRELFDALIYRDRNGKLVQLPLEGKSRLPFGLVHVAPQDADWVGLVNTKEGFGFFSLRLSAATGNFEIPGTFLHKAGTYFYAPSDGNYVYWVRPLVYTWGDYATSNLLTFVPRESFFYEKNAYVMMRLSDDLPVRIGVLLQKLSHPLRVF
jgi:hypothetical protein